MRCPQTTLQQPHSNGVPTLTGGLGTLSEFMDVSTKLIQDDEHKKPLVGLINIDGFFDGLLLQLETLDAKGFTGFPRGDLVVADSARAVLDQLAVHFAPAD